MQKYFRKKCNVLAIFCKSFHKMKKARPEFDKRTITYPLNSPQRLNFIQLALTVYRLITGSALIEVSSLLPNKVNTKLANFTFDV